MEHIWDVKYLKRSDVTHLRRSFAEQALLKQGFLLEI